MAPIDFDPGDAFRKLDVQMERRNQRRAERVLAWVEMLDALGWMVALRWPGSHPILSRNAEQWLRESGAECPTWEDLRAWLSGNSTGRHVVNIDHVQIWGGCEQSDLLQADELSHAGLSKREVEVVNWFREGKTGPEIAIILGISRRTVESHAARIYRKLGLHQRSQLIFRTNLAGS